MKKILCFFLMVVVFLSTTITASADKNVKYITREAAVQRIISELYKTDGTKDFDFEQNYCVHENGYAHFVPADPLKAHPILCEIYNSVESSGFSDVKGINDNTIYITLAKAMGIINGNGDKTFAPDEFATYNQAVKMIVCTVGYGAQLAEQKGGYPEGYIAVAGEFGITKGMKFNGADKIKSEDFDLMLDKCIAMKGSPLNVMMIDFTPPDSPEVCVKTYAQAVKNRFGTIQYALMDSELRNKTRNDFVGFYWVTGVSSPWVEGYDITKEDELLYKITFHYSASTGPADDEVLELKLKKADGYYQISDLK